MPSALNKNLEGASFVISIRNDVAEYQRKRLASGVSNRTVNYEVGALREILRRFGLWGPIADCVRALPERHDVGRALSSEDEAKLISAASASRSPALLPLFLISLDTGMRTSELQEPRQRDLKLNWVEGNITSCEVIVPKSKTAAGTGRLIPFTRRARACLSLWLSRFPLAGPDSFVFPFHQVGISGNSRAIEIYEVDLDRPMGSWRKGWLGACKKAGVRYRWHEAGRECEHQRANDSIPRRPRQPANARTIQSHPFAREASGNPLPRRARQHANVGRDRAQNRAQFQTARLTGRHQTTENNWWAR
jgi:hypothetical protein